MKAILEWNFPTDSLGVHVLKLVLKLAPNAIVNVLDSVADSARPIDDDVEIILVSDDCVLAV
jgi:hypothetical protein